MGQIENHHIPIFHILETIERINKHLALHQSAKHPDEMAIEQWQGIRSDLQRQLGEMLVALDALPIIPEKSFTPPTPRKRGMSAEHMAKIREARLAKRAEAVSSGAVIPKPKKGEMTADNTPKRRGMSPEHMAKIREARQAKNAAEATTIQPKQKGNKASGH